MIRCLLVTGGAGFIGSNFIRFWLSSYPGDKVINYDLLTYAGNLDNVVDIPVNDHYHFINGDINNTDLIKGLLAKEKVNCIVHFAAESHVDRSIKGPQAFVQTNILGTYNLLEAARAVWLNHQKSTEQNLFIHVSTDEVYGSLLPEEDPFTENSPYRPNSPYSASKAAADHFVRAYYKTYGLKTIISNCSNNYGPYQFPEKLIPLMIINAIEGKSLPVYGDGKQIRDWIHVNDHCRGLDSIIMRGRPGESYNLGGSCEQSNIEVVLSICDILQRIKPPADGRNYKDQIAFVKDRPGHDKRYAIYSQKCECELGWKPLKPFNKGLEETILWYIDNQVWWEKVRDGRYKEFIEQQYSTRTAGSDNT